VRLCQLAAQAGLVHSRWRSGAVHCHCWGRRDGRRRRCCSYARWRGWPGCRGSWFVGSCRPRCRRQRLRRPVARRPVQLLLTVVACACSRRSRRTRQGAALNDDLAQRLAERCLLLGAQAAAADRQWVLGQRGPQHLHSRQSAGCSFLEPTLPLASRAHTHSSPPAAPTWLLITPDAGAPSPPPLSGKGIGCGSTRLSSCSAEAARSPSTGWFRGTRAAAGTGRLGR
jgi:hypothetical protein